MLVDGARVAKSRRLVDRRGDRGAGRARGRRAPAARSRRSPVVVRYEDADVVGGGQARGARGASRAPGIPTARWSTACWRATRRSPTSATRPARASCTGSTATRAACSWSRARRPRTRAWWRCSPPTTSNGATSRWCGACPTSPRGVIDAPIGRSVRRPTRMAVREGGRSARTAYEVRAHVPRARGRRCSSAGWRRAARTRSGCTSRRSATRWWATPRTAGAGRRWRSTARSCTPAGLAFAHPVTGEPVRVEEELPPELARWCSPGSRRRVSRQPPRPAGGRAVRASPRASSAPCHEGRATSPAPRRPTRRCTWIPAAAR